MRMKTIRFIEQYTLRAFEYDITWFVSEPASQPIGIHDASANGPYELHPAHGEVWIGKNRELRVFFTQHRNLVAQAGPKSFSRSF